MSVSGNQACALAAAFVLLFASVLVIVSIRNSSPLWDEPTYISSGYYFFRTSDPSMMVSHPMLAKEIAALPLLVMRPALVLPGNASDYVNYSYVKFAYDFIYGFNRASADSILFASRIPFVLLFLLLGFFVFQWAKRLYGDAAGLFAVVLYSFSPLILAHAGAALTDLPVTLFIFVTAYFFWRFMLSPSWKLLLAAGASFGLALASKETANYLLPIMVVLLALLWWKKRLPALKHGMRPVISAFGIFAGLLLIAGIVVWAVYGFQFGTLASSGGSARYGEIAIGELSGILPSGAVSAAEWAAANVPVPFPSFIATYGVAAHAALKPRIPAYLNGETYIGGKWQFYITSFLLKTPIPFLAMLLLVVMLFLRQRKHDSLNEWFLLIPPLVIFAFFLPLQFNVGLKHMMPVFPFLFVLCSRLVSVRFAHRQARVLFAALLGVLLLWYVIGTLMVHPYYVSYFNEFVGPENGHKYLASADLSTGSNLPALKAYMEQRGIPSVQLSYLGSADPSYYGINYTYLPSPYFQGWDPHYSPQLPQNYTEECYPRTGLIAISATNLHGVWLVNTSCYAWLAQLAPVDSIGYEILIYNVTEDDIN